MPLVQTRPFSERFPPSSFSLEAVVREQGRAVVPQEPEKRSRISQQVQALLMSISVALATIRSRQSTNSSFALANLEQCYSALESNAAHLLGALDSQTSLQTMAYLCSEQASLSAQLNGLRADNDKLKVQDYSDSGNQNPGPDALEKALNDHPLIKGFNLEIAILTNIKEQNKEIQKNIQDIHHGLEDFSVVIKAAGMEDPEMAAVLEKTRQELAKQAFETDKEKGLSAEEIYSRKEEVKAAIRKRMDSIVTSAREIQHELKDGYNTGKAKIASVYDRLVMVPANRLKEKCPDYYDKSRDFLANRTANIGVLSRNVANYARNLYHSIHESTDIASLQSIMDTKIDYIKSETSLCSEALAFDERAINKELEMTLHKKESLSNLLSGKSDDVAATARLLNMEENDLRKQVDDFRNQNGIPNLEVTSLLGRVMNMLGNDRISGRARNGRELN